MNKFNNAGENNSSLEQNVISTIAHQLGKKSFTLQTDMGDAIYEWVDNQVENLSSVRLAEILRWTEPNGCVDSCFVKAARQELIKRGHCHQTWN